MPKPLTPEAEARIDNYFQRLFLYPPYEGSTYRERIEAVKWIVDDYGGATPPTLIPTLAVAYDNQIDPKRLVEMFPGLTEEIFNTITLAIPG